jgi:quinol monooxygenase YgiN
MLVQSVRYTFTPEDAGRAEAMLRELRDRSRSEAGVLGFDVMRSQETSNAFVIWEQYRDRAALDSHAATEHFKRLVIDGVRPLALQRVGELLVPI